MELENEINHKGKAKCDTLDEIRGKERVQQMEEDMVANLGGRTKAVGCLRGGRRQPPGTKATQNNGKGEKVGATV